MPSDFLKQKAQESRERTSTREAGGNATKPTAQTSRAAQQPSSFLRQKAEASRARRMTQPVAQDLPAPASHAQRVARRDDGAVRENYALRHPEMTGGEAGAQTRAINTGWVRAGEAKQKAQEEVSALQLEDNRRYLERRDTLPAPREETGKPTALDAAKQRLKAAEGELAGWTAARKYDQVQRVASTVAADPFAVSDALKKIGGMQLTKLEKKEAENIVQTALYSAIMESEDFKKWDYQGWALPWEDDYGEKNPYDKYGMNLDIATSEAMEAAGETPVATKEEERLLDYLIYKSKTDPAWRDNEELTPNRYNQWWIANRYNPRVSKEMAEQAKEEGLWGGVKMSLNSAARSMDDAWAGLFGIERPVTASDYAIGEYRESLDGLPRIAFDASTTIGDMAPSIGASLLTKNPNVGLGVMAGSVFGRSTESALREGYNPVQARLYGAANAASEAMLGRLLGGITNLGGGNGVFSGLLGESAANINNGFLRFAAQVGLNSADEALEEYTQGVLDPVFRNMILGEDNEIKLISEDAAYDAFMALITTPILEGPSQAGAVIDQNKAFSEMGQKLHEMGPLTADTVLRAGLDGEASTQSHKLAAKLADQQAEGKAISDKNLGRLYQTILTEESAQKTADREAAERVYHGEVLDTVREHIGEVKDLPAVAKLTGSEFQKRDGDKRSLRTKVIEFFNSIGNKVTRADIGDIVLNDAGARDSLGHGYGKVKAATFAALPSVLRDGKIIKTRGPYEGHGYDSIFIAAPVDIGDTPCYVGALVIKDANTQRYKLHEVLTTNENGTPLFKSETAETGKLLRSGEPLGEPTDTTHNVSASADPVHNVQDVPPSGSPVNSIPQAAENVKAAEARVARLEAQLAELDQQDVARGAAELGTQGQATVKAMFLEGQNAQSYVQGMREVYDAAQAGTALEGVDSQAVRSLNDHQRRAAYEAGRLDAMTQQRAQESQTLGKVKRAGLVYDDYVKQNLSRQEAERMDTLCRRLGLRARFVDHIGVGEAAANGSINDTEVRIAKDAEDPALVVFGHEVGHWLERNAPEAYEAFRQFATQHRQTEIDATMELYRRAGQELSQDEVLREFANDDIGRIIGDPTALQAFFEANKNNRTFIQKVADALRALWQKLTGKDRQRVKTAEEALVAALKASETQTAKRLTSSQQDDGVKYSIGYDINNTPFVTVDEDILAGVPESKWLSTVRTVLQERFPDGVTVARSHIRINAITTGELTRSGYTRWLRESTPDIYADKFRALANVDEVLLAARDYVGEGLKHSRKDNIKEFARGVVQLRIGANDYIADVVVGTTTGENLVLYDLVNLLPTTITERKQSQAGPNSPVGAQPRTPEIASETKVSHRPPNVNGDFSLKGGAALAERTAQTDGVKYSIKRTSTMTLQEQFKEFDSGTMRSSDAFSFGMTPDTMLELGLDQLPVAMAQSDFRKSTQRKHDIPRRVIKKLGQNLASPILAFYDGDTAAVVIDEVDRNGKPVVVALKKGVVMDRMPLNGITSIFGLDHQDAWFDNQTAQGKSLKVFQKEKAEALFQTDGSKRLGENELLPTNRSVAQGAGDVNGELSLKGGAALAERTAQLEEQSRQEGWSQEQLQGEVRAAVGQVLQELAEEYGTIKPGESPAREVQVPRKTAKDNKVSQTVRTILEAQATPEAAIPSIEELTAKGEFSYGPLSDKTAMERASKTIEYKGWGVSLADWFQTVKSGAVSKENTAMGWALYNQAANTGDIQTAMSILQSMVLHQRNAAQAVQATRILKQMSPETQLYGVQRSVAGLQEELNRRFGDDKAPKLVIDQELAEQLLAAVDQEGRDRVMQEIYRDIGRQMPSNLADKWNAWRYLSMLGNARTHVRNIVGNAGFVPVVAAKDMTATAIERAVSAVSGGRLERNKAMVGLGSKGRGLLAAAWGDYAKVQDAAMGGGKYSEFQNANKYIEDGRVIFKGKLGKPLEAARRANSKALDVEDMWFSKPHYAYAMAQYCAAQGITAETIRSGDAVALDKARAYAIREAQKATYRDTNALSQLMGGLGRDMRRSDKALVRGAGAMVEGVLPFRKTPANILARGVEYSPLGLVKGLSYDLYQVKQGKMSGSEAIDHISAGLTGTGLLALGAFLAAQGLLRGKGPGDDKERELEKLQGHQDYALEIGDVSVTLDWLAPEALPLFVGANLWETAQEDGEVTMSGLLSAIGNVSDPFLEMSCLQSLNDIFDSVGYASQGDTSPLTSALVSAATSYLTQGLPTIFGQGERVFETQRESTFTSKDAFLTGDAQYFLGKVSGKVPGWEFQQIPYIDAWGRTEDTGGLGQRAFNNLLNPAYVSEIETSEMEEELVRLYEATGENVFPSRAKKYFQVKGERRDLDAEEYVDYATKKGQTARSVVEALVERKAYRALSDGEKAEAVADAYKYAEQTARKSVAKDYEPDSWVAKAQTAQNHGIPVEVYILLRAQCAGIESIKDKDGRTIDNSKGLQIMEAVYAAPGLKDSQRRQLFADFGVGKSIQHYNKALVTEKLRKMRR